MMKYSLLMGLGLGCLTLSAQAEDLCRQKEQAIEQKIEIARQHDNQREVTGLERALTETRAGCHAETLKARHTEKIASQQHKIAEREQELKEAQAKGDEDKIAKHKQKLAEARQELKDLQDAGP